MNQKIQKYEIELAKIKKDIKEREDRMSIQFSINETALHSLDKKVQEFIDLLSSRLCAIEKSVKKCSESVCKNEASCRETLVDFPSHKKDMLMISGKLDLMQDKMNSFRETLDCKNRDLRDAINLKARILKEEIQSAPSEIPGMKKNIADSLDLMSANFSGVIDELKNVKHDMFLMQKHIEELFNKFARMK
jgi:hypothetical protein